MPYLSESDTWAKLIDPAIHARGWTEDLIRREETAGAQDAAIRAALEKIARCEKAHQPKRALLSLATGAGKTFIAVHLLERIADAGQLRRALFICDRDELRSQAAAAFQNVFR